MNETTPSVFTSASNSEVNTVLATTCEEPVTIKQELQDMHDENFEIHSPVSETSVSFFFKFNFQKVEWQALNFSREGRLFTSDFRV